MRIPQSLKQHLSGVHFFSRILLLMLLSLCVLHGQTKRIPAFNHPLSIEQNPLRMQKTISAVPETTKILVAMVAFQEDADARTTGNGSFDTTSSSKKIIDPPPHNKAYVENHMAFVQNYFRKVSNGKHIVTATVLDSVYRLAHPIAYYSPLRTSTDNIELRRLMEDSWSAVDVVTPGIVYENYNAFLILHAGVGRDVDLTSLYGYDPTPFDIPSIYLNLQSLRKNFATYQGAPVRDSAYYITSSMIIPETESRELQGIDGPVPLRLGINGLIAASIGSHLGLPDLFDTKTGNSGIGRFGLMDGQSIFSWSGLFPPEPSAWEKYFLGWIDPITINSGDATYSLPAASLNTNADSIYKVPISSKEYFLIENRNRDANRDSTTVTMILNGQTFIRTRERDTVGFNAFDQDSLYGVVTDVDEFDWSLPGGIDRNTKELYDGGILVWHINENIIDAKYATDAVNADPDHRGVDLEEADGSQDIGQSYGLFTSGSGSEDGTPFDFWYAGNKAPLRLQIGGNAFTPSSHPDSRSNNLANSHVYVKSFSSRAPRMTVTIQVGDDHAKPLPGFPKNIGFQVGNNSLTMMDNSSGLLIATSEFRYDNSVRPPVTLIGPPAIYGWGVSGSTLLAGGDTSGRLVTVAGLTPDFGSFFGKVAVGNFDSDPTPDLTIGGFDIGIRNRVRVWTLKDGNSDQKIDTLYNKDVARFIRTSPVISDSLIAFGATNGKIYCMSYDGSRIDTIQLSVSDSSWIVGLSLWSQPKTFVAVSQRGTVGVVLPSGVILSKNFNKSIPASAVSGTISSSIGKRIAFASSDGYVYFTDSLFNVAPGFPVYTAGQVLNSPALADVDGDGQKDIVVFSGNKIYAINATGAILDNFPVRVASDKTILTSPIVADINGNRISEIVAVTQEGLVVAYDRSGKLIDGFPIQSGINHGSTPAVFYLASTLDIGLAVASDDGTVYAWRTGSTGLAQPPVFPWPQYMHDAQNTGLDEAPLQFSAKTNDFFPASLAYNWPNPVGPEHGFKTHIRYYVGQTANVTIKIFDLAGDLVSEIKGPGVGGYDNEVEWDVSQIQSGIYFAHVDAKGTNASGNAVIKIAVVK